ncbi:MAG: cobalt ECF transporter T component CbiQ [Eubacteriales bacterium]|nr:cobalt ECF transporter T component CbiQ [Eubacteriales bacterium]
MQKIASSMYQIRLLDQLARQDSVIHRLHPLAKLLITLIFLIIVVSFPATETISLLPLFFYPVIILVLADIKLHVLVKRILWIEPFILSIGLINSIFDQTPISWGFWTISRGQVMLISLLIKSVLTLSASFLLIMTTSVEKITVALQLLRLPKLFALQFLLTFRYITVLAEELSHMMRAYFLRAPAQKGLRHDYWGVISGQLLIRTYGRAQRVYQSMVIRGYQGKFHTGGILKFGIIEIVYLIGWTFLFLGVRCVNLPILMMQLFT